MYHHTVVLGYLGADPDIRVMPNGNSVANLSIATTEKWRDKESGENKERTEWYRCTAFGRTAEIAKEYCKKGKLVLVEGRMRTEKWEDKEGNERYSTKLYIDRLVLGPDRGNSSGGSDDGQDGGDGDAGTRPPRPAARGARQSTRKEVPPSKPATDGDFDDDIPF